MALTPQEQRQLLIDLVSGRISKKEYDEILYNQRIRDLRTASNQAPNPLTETEKRLFTRAAQSTQSTVPTVNDQGVIDLSTRGSTTKQFGTPSQDLDEPSLGDIYAQGGGIGSGNVTPSQDLDEPSLGDIYAQGGGIGSGNVTPSQDLDEPSLGDIYAQGGGIGSGDVTTPPVTTPPVTETPDEYGYTPSQYQAGIIIYRKDAPAGGERVFSNADLKQAFSNGYSLEPVDITEGPDAGTSAEEVSSGITSGSQELSTGFVDSQIWEYEGNKFVVWQVPGTMMYMRYAASDSELDMLYSGRERPDEVQASDTMWTSSVYFGNVNELDEKVITTGDSPFVGFVDNFEKATLGRPWLKDDDEMFSLWVEGYVEDRDITTEEWSNTEWWNNSTKEERDWLVTSKGRGIGDADFPADAKTLLDQNRILYLETMKNAGIANADTIRDANGNSLAEWFADKVTFGEFDAVKASEQIQALSDVTSGIQVDERVTNWLEGKGEVDQTRTGYASARALALEWLGPVYGALDEATLQDYAGIIRNAENPDVGADLLQEELKSQRKVLFNTDIYDENLTYKQIASPWQNYSFQFLGERMDETSQNWLNVLLANDQNTADQELTAYGLNNNIVKVVDTLSDNIANSVGVTQTGVQRGFST
jgi:hypothetical protein